MADYDMLIKLSWPLCPNGLILFTTHTQACNNAFESQHYVVVEQNIFVWAVWSTVGYSGFAEILPRANPCI